MRPVLPAVCSLGMYHFSLPLMSYVPQCIRSAQSCAQRLSALYSKLRRLAAGLRASRLLQQMPCASLCPRLRFPSELHDFVS